jgi:hypothetical protein
MLTNPNVKENPNYGLNYVNAIDSVMAKPFYPSSTVLKEADYDDDKEDVNDAKEPKDEETERNMAFQKTEKHYVKQRSVCGRLFDGIAKTVSHGCRRINH